MKLRIGLENNNTGRSVAWMLEHPGCYAYGAGAPAALAQAPQAFDAYRQWVQSHGGDWLESGEAEPILEETWDVYRISEDYERVTEGYEVEAWFLHDWKPLGEQDIRRALLLLDWSRAELLGAVRGLAAEALQVRQRGQRWSIAGILKHVGGAEWWYMDRLGLAFPRQQVSEDPFARLEQVRSHLLQTLPGLIGSQQVTGIDGEFWSPRKLLRRAVWHERDHAGHIRELTASLSQ